MNAEVAYRYRERKAEVEELGEEQHRRHALKHLKLKTVLKESHCQPVQALAFNTLDAQCGNLFATVGADQAAVYDDQHMGDFIGVVVHFVNQPTPLTKGGELRACAWLRTEGWTQHPQGDACMAIAGAAGDISVISVVEARVITLLRGHSREVIDLVASAARPGLLASLARDGNLRVWDAACGACLASHESDATALALHSDGSQLATVDGLLFLPGGRLVSKSADGRAFVWDYAARRKLASWKVPGCGVSAAAGGRCRMGTTPCGDYVCAGNDGGGVYVFDAATGERVVHVSPIKVTAPVRACGLSADCRHLLAACGNGYIFRFEYARPELGAAGGEQDSASDDEDDKC
ncbi:hypothetical protein WJX81_006855 [Elliptochloris bilobata]|uniref:Guanine nucleotide-binding protein subunit beta-like protein n=1 Tax=Elliptochloris bilobata TaxID=381761 RepID=A0AAW1RUW0_9CHLO